MFEPTNEQGAIAVFCAGLQASKWEIVTIGTPFPDAVLRMDGIEWRTEFEYKASNFMAHGHDYRQCDLIVCWENDFRDCPIPVIELRDPDWINVRPSKGNPVYAQMEYWRDRALKAEASVQKLLKSMPAKQGKIISKRKRDGKLLLVKTIVDRGSLSLADIGKEIGVSKSTVGNYVTELCGLGVLDKLPGGGLRVNGNHEAFLSGKL